MIGRTISHYRIVDTIGAGGMGVVYKAIDTRLERVVALKFLSPHLSADPRAKERFLREARSASLLDHPHIGTIYEIDEEPEGGVFIAMAYYDGPSLERLLAAGPLPFDRTVAIVVQVGEALARAHARGVVHRDIKPANILMTASGEAKLIDFGIAKVAASALTHTGSALGTPAYMAPEQIRGETDHRTDIWALGVVFFQMVTGELPFGGETVYAQASAILHEARRVCADSVPAPVVQMLDRMLAKSPDERYQSMEAVVADARRLLGNAGMPSGTGWLTAVAQAPAPTSERFDGGDQQTRAPSEPSAERRQVTVLTCGLLDFTDLADRLDPEELHELLLEYRTRCREIVRQLDGHLAHETDDELVVYFGYPTTREDGGGRAVRCGLAIVEATRSLPSRLAGSVPALRGRALHATVGIHTGIIVAGDRRGTQATGVTGNVANIAWRAREAAAAGQVVVTAETYRVVRRTFHCAALGVVPARGSTKAIDVYRVLSEKKGAVAEDERATAPPIGRDREIERLAERWERARAGTGQVVLVGGEPGIGKSRLLSSLRSMLSGQPHGRLDCQCSAYHANSPLYPFVDLLRGLFGLERADLSDGDKLELLVGALAHHGVTAPADHRVFASLLSLPVPADQDTLRLGVKQLKARTLALLSNLLPRLGGADPTVLLVEDLHWIDPTSLELLGLLVERAAAERILIVATHRSEFVPPWGDRPHVSHLSLGRLTPADVVTLVHRVTEGRAVPAEVMAQIVSTTDGVPLFVEELTKTVIESGALRETDRGYVLAAPHATLEVPTTIQDSLMARLDRLPGAKPVAQLASVLGREFPYAWLAAVSPEPETVLHRELERLVAAGLLQQRGVAPLASFSFKHALVKDVAYQSMLRGDRQDHHRRVADTLLEKFSADSSAGAEIIAHHYTEGGQPEPAARFWQLAGQRALEQSHDVEAVAHLTRGLEVLHALPADSARQRQELTMQIARAAGLRATRGFAAQATGAAYEEARVLAVAAGDANALITVLNGLYAYHLVRAEHARARPVAEELLQLANRLGDPTHQMLAHRALGAVLFHTGDAESGRAHLERSLAAYDPEKHARLAPLLGTDHAETAMSFLSLVLWVLGRPEQALRTQLGGLAHAERLGHLHSIAQALTYLCFVRLLRREPAGVEESAGRLVALADEHSFPLMSASGRFWAAWAQSRRGDRGGGIERMEQAAADWWATGAQTYRSFAETVIAEARLSAGDLDAADVLLQSATARVQASDERWAEPELLRIRGELELARGDGDAGVRLFRSAVDRAAMLGAPMWRLRAATSLARCLVASGRAAEARDMLAPLLTEMPEAETPESIELKDTLRAAGDAPSAV